VAASLLSVIVAAATIWFFDLRFNLGLFRDLARAFPQVAALRRFETGA